MNPLQRDKCIGRRLVASGGDFGITYAPRIRTRSPLKAALAAFPFAALIVLVIVATVARH